MIYTSREKLTCCVLQDENETVSFEALRPILMEYPSSIVYCEKDGQLVGIISVGDIGRAYKAGDDFVAVNRRFIGVRAGEYMRARQIFKDRDEIHSVPVIGEQNELLGEYARWDDYIAVDDFARLVTNPYCLDLFSEKKRIVLVKPCRAFTKKQELMRKWQKNLAQTGAQVSAIDRGELMTVADDADYILFVDENELRGTEVLYEKIFGGGGKTLALEKGKKL